MAIESNIHYTPPKDRFVKVSNEIVENFTAETIGIYCKIIKLSYCKTLSIDVIAKRIKISDKKVRKIIVELEEAGYVVRTAIRDDKNRMRGWNYNVFAEPVPEEERSHAGKKTAFPVLPNFRQDGKPDKTENGQDNIIIDNTISNNIEKTFDNNKKKSTYVDKNFDGSLPLFTDKSDEEVKYEAFMVSNYPYIMKMDKPLTISEAKKLKELYGDEVVYEVLSAMNNHKQLNKKYRSAYQTANNWCTRRIQNNTQAK